jgi:threonyl-tRNA synthetase
MRILFIHADSMEYELREKTKFAEALPPGTPEKASFGETLVLFTSAEEGDADTKDDLLQNAVREIAGVAEKLNVRELVLYPYAHLSSALAKPADAQALIKELESKLARAGYKVHRSPFGWYKAFSLKCKGHPLSELSKQITAEKHEPTREDVVNGIESEFIVLRPDGREIKLTLDNQWIKNSPELDESVRRYILSEELKNSPGTEPPSIKAMKRLELVDYEPASDSGNFRLYPKGALMFSLIRDWADRIAHDRLGAIEIDTPILYDWSQPDINAQAKSFHQRHYMVTAGDDSRKFVLRFAGDFGLFRIMRDATVSYRQLPVRVYEFSKSFRYEQRGELLGLKRLRAFHMPDIHTFAADLDGGWEEYKLLYRTFSEEIERTGIEYVSVFRVVRDFYERYRSKIAELLTHTGKPVFIEILSSSKHYWVIKNEFQGIDSTGRAYQLSTVQLDLEDAERYGITYTDRDGKKKGLVITHSSIGSVERWIYGFLEEALKKERPYLPLWLAPTQVRLIPVKPEHAEDCANLAGQLGIRADIDDREEKLSRRIRDAEVEWVNMIIVYGDREKSSDKLPVRMRNGEMLQLTVAEIKKIIDGHMKDFPMRSLAVPMTLSKNIVFHG